MLSRNIGEKETFRGVSVQTNGFGSNLNRIGSNRRLVYRFGTEKTHRVAECYVYRNDTCTEAIRVAE